MVGKYIINILTLPSLLYNYLLMKGKQTNANSFQTKYNLQSRVAKSNKIISHDLIPVVI